MEKGMKYRRAKFSPEVIIRGLNEYLERTATPIVPFSGRRLVETGDESWNFDSDQEFFAEYRRPIDYASFYRVDRGASFSVKFFGESMGPHTKVEVEGAKRPQIEAVFSKFDAAYEASIIPAPPVRPKVFIGHGRNPMWRDLRDHLQDLQDYEVIAFEIGSRAGDTAQEVLDNLVGKASIAFLLHTAEDPGTDGTFRARDNVIHETGLFQGRLGRSRAIVVMEDGCSEYSNIAGLQQIRFPRNGIRETFGDVAATIRREFG